MEPYRTWEVVGYNHSGKKQTRRVSARDVKHLRRILRVCSFVASEFYETNACQCGKEVERITDDGVKDSAKSVLKPAQ